MVDINFIYRKFKERINEKFKRDDVFDYIYFIDESLINNAKFDEPVYTENHHILPKHAFSEYIDFKLNPWNKAKLTPSQHIKAHILLSNIFPESAFAVSRMSKYNGIDIPLDLIDAYKENLSYAARQRTIGTIWVSKGDSSKMIDPNSLQDFFDNGWELGRGEQFTSNKDYIWITDGEYYKMVGPNKIPEGWCSGGPLRGRVHAYNPLTNHSIFVNEEEVPEGYHIENINAKGNYYTSIKTNEVRLFKTEEDIDLKEWRPGNLRKGKKYYYDPVTKESKEFFEGDQPKDWIKGNYSQMGIYRTRGRKWYTNPEKTKSKMFYPGDQPKDWTPGRK